jgi:vancomycin resistance protein YoaR
VPRYAWLVLFVALGGFVAWLALPASPAPPKGAPLAHVTLAGKPLPPDADEGMMLDAARQAAQGWLDEPMTMDIGGTPTARTRQQLGARIDGLHLRSLVAQLRDPSSALRRRHPTGTPLALPVPYTLDTAAALEALSEIKDASDLPPVDARFDFKTQQLSADKPGRRMDAWGTLSRLEDALAASTARLDAIVQPVAAKRTAATFSGVATTAVLGWFETKYARDMKHEARTYNLRLAASRFDGYVLLPGETFDFNRVVGARSEANGYKVAPVIAQGELVDGIGGGTCQVAGTLHAAAFFAGLDIPERKPHTRPSFYIKMGLDAAVAFPTVTLELKNPYTFPVVLHETLKEGVVRAEILGPGRTRDVTFGRRIDSIVPFVEKEMPDLSVPRGERELKQRGIPGFKITRWRILRDGSFATREHHQDVYPPTTQIWRVGTGPAEAGFDPRDDEHPEYVADEYLFISQGADIQGPHGSDMVESRVAGKSGTYGWTVREGFAKEDPGQRDHERGQATSRRGKASGHRPDEAAAGATAQDEGKAPVD